MRSRQRRRITGLTPESGNSTKDAEVDETGKNFLNVPRPIPVNGYGRTVLHTQIFINFDGFKDTVVSANFNNNITI